MVARRSPAITTPYPVRSATIVVPCGARPWWPASDDSVGRRSGCRRRGSRRRTTTGRPVGLGEAQGCAHCPSFWDEGTSTKSSASSSSTVSIWSRIASPSETSPRGRVPPPWGLVLRLTERSAAAARHSRWGMTSGDRDPSGVSCRSAWRRRGTCSVATATWARAVQRIERRHAQQRLNARGREIYRSPRRGGDGVGYRRTHSPWKQARGVLGRRVDGRATSSSVNIRRRRRAPPGGRRGPCPERMSKYCRSMSRRRGRSQARPSRRTKPFIRPRLAIQSMRSASEVGPVSWPSRVRRHSPRSSSVASSRPSGRRRQNWSARAYRSHCTCRAVRRRSPPDHLWVRPTSCETACISATGRAGVQSRPARTFLEHGQDARRSD